MAAGTLTLNGLLAYQQHFKSGDPLTFDVVDSYFDNDLYRLVFLVRNCTRHGVYIEDFCTKKPKDLEVLVGEADKSHMALGCDAAADVRADKFFPKLMKPLPEVFEFGIRLYPPEKARYKQVQFVEFEYHYSVLGEAGKPKKGSLPAKLRKKPR